MKNIRPITDLRKTNEISDQCHLTNEPIFITKNGYNDLVIMSDDYYNTIKNNQSYVLKNNKKIVIDNDYIFNSNASNHYMIKVGVATNNIDVASPSLNTLEIKKIIDSKKDNNLDILVFPELSITGYTCLDLFYQKELLNKVEECLIDLSLYTKGIKTLIFVGAPLIYNDKLYNCAIAINDGEILGVIPKTYLPSYNEFYDSRYFNSFEGDNGKIRISNKVYPFGTKILFVNKNQPLLKVGCEICEDLWAVNPPSTNACLNGANIIVNLSASNEYINKNITRLELVKQTSNRLICGYVYSSAGLGESSQDLLFSGHNIICENGNVLAEAKLFENEYIESEIDIEKISSLRLKSPSFGKVSNEYLLIAFESNIEEKKLTRVISKNPFIEDNTDYTKVIKMQALGLIKRMKHINAKDVVIGVSGGLDSTLALLALVEAYKIMGIDSNHIHTIMLPCFGTSSRTFNNAKGLCEVFKTNLVTINIKDSVTKHLKDIDHDINNQNVVYENAQARERTQVLFDFANKVNGLVIGTGDLSELALGFCTYNGDHMSNYSLNSSIPKTLIQHIIKQYAYKNSNVKDILLDIVSTPISPELLPANDDNISQVTEDIVGPYELHDFFIYNLLSYNFSINKIYYLACIAFKDKYDKDYIAKILKIFIKKFFNNQFKRSCLPDGVKVTSISISPRGDFKMPSDASNFDFLK